MNNRRTSVILLIVVVLIGYYTYQKVSHVAETNTVSNQEGDIKSRLDMIQYSTESVGNKTRISSNNYKFELMYPNQYEEKTDRVFSRYIPDSEYVILNLIDNEDQRDIIYNVRIGLLLDKTIERKVSEDIQGIKASTFPSEELIDIRDTDIKLQESDITINGEPGIRLEYTGAFGGEIISYYFLNNLKYYIITVSRNHGTKFTPAHLQEIRTVINSFLFI